MGPGIFRRIFSRSKKRRFFAWQIELTTRCPLRCRMCVRAASEEWHSADIGLDDFRRLAPNLREVENVVLGGWGEPLLHKDLAEAIRIVKGAGAQAGFVTSGRDLTGDYARDLAAAGLDFVGFSLAGATRKTHNSIRVHSDLPTVLQAIEAFRRIGNGRPDAKPNLHIVYLMLKDNLGEIPLLLDLAKSVGVRTVFLINLVQVSNEWQDEQKVFSYGPDLVHEQFLHEMEIKAKGLGIALLRPFLSPEKIGICAENPVKNLYVSVTGQVAPCVHLAPPVPSPMRRFYHDKERIMEKVSFGNIFDTPFERIWNSPGYSAFRTRFEARQREFEELYSFAAVIAPDAGHLKKLDKNITEPPKPCTICHKMLGF